ncbi:cation:proton antiporter [Blastococcus sp. TF02A_35]|uniref:cation:proton antiporter domain-containing protein n=1 Tax=Blastococcus sp. TF02A-35 TaxID=2559612 RepID=UPI001073F1EE|nr:cation:proton antiporter [Blastococcus sp. TF02A_35]TFV52218.1 sodium:proton antiporter [Blastococcus sp. TF02A_35]
MEPTGVAYAAAGGAALLAALLPRLTSRAPASMPMVFVGLGVLAFALVPGLPSPDPLEHSTTTVHLTELVVIVSLMGAGLALDRPLGWRGWGSTWRLLAVTMPLTVLAAAWLGSWLLGLGAAAALLLGAALAPTDPVLATEVQVGEPTDDEQSEDEARFALTSEAGLNDGLAFPFTYAAIAVAGAGLAPSGWLGEWLAVDVLWRLAAGIAAGAATGWVLRRLFFSRAGERARLAERAEGFVALCAIFLAYGVAEVVEGYGFVAVFVCALTIRAAERTHDRHQVLHAHVEQLERLLTVLLLLLVGGAVARGILDGLGWREWVFAAVFLLVVRPLGGRLAFLGSSTGTRERWVVSFFGVRGIGSLYYLAYGLAEADIAGAEQLWRVTVLVVVGSVVLQGVTAGPVIHRLDRMRERRARDVHGSADRAPVTPV